MDYASLIRRSWRLTWRHRFLWVLGLFVPGTTSSCYGNGGSEGLFEGLPSTEESEAFSPGIIRTFDDLISWLEQNLGVVLLLIAFFLVLLLVFAVVSLIAQGGMARATAMLAQGRPISAGEAWQAGLHLFWRYTGLWLLQLGISLLAMLLIMLPVLLLFVLLAQGVGNGAQVLLIVLAIPLVLALILVAIIFFVGLSIAIAYAQRAIAVEDVGPLVGLRAGARLLRARLGDSALVWLISAGIGIGLAIAMAIAVLVLLVPLGALGVGLFSSLGVSPVFIAYTVIGLLVLVAAVWFLNAIAATYAWNYWTLAYLRFTGRLSERLDAIVTP